MVDHTVDFLKPEFLDLILFQNCSVIFRPFILQSKFDDLLHLIEVFFEIDRFEFDLIDIESIRMYIEDIQQRALNSKILLFIPNLTPEISEILQIFPDVQFIAIDHDTNQDFALKLDRWAVFNKKTSKFEKIFPLNILNKSFPSYKWCEYCIEKAKKHTNTDFYRYLDEFARIIGDLFTMLPEFSISQYYYLVEDLTPIERVAAKMLCEIKYHIELDEYLPNDDGDLLDTIKNSIGNACLLDDSEKSISEFNKPSIAPSSSIDIAFLPKPSDLNETQQYFVELTHIKSISNDYYLAWELALKKWLDSNKMKGNSPEEAYVMLRQSVWHESLPIEFIESIFEFYLYEIIKKQSLNQKGLPKFLQEEYAQFKMTFKDILPVRIDSLFNLEKFLHNELLRENMKSTIPERLPFIVSKNELNKSQILSITETKKSAITKQETNKSLQSNKTISNHGSINQKDFELRFTQNFAKIKQELSVSDPLLLKKIRNEIQKYQNSILKRFNV